MAKIKQQAIYSFIT